MAKRAKNTPPGDHGPADKSVGRASAADGAAGKVAGDDTVAATAADTIAAASDADTAAGGADTLASGGGADTIAEISGADTVASGQGADTIASGGEAGDQVPGPEDQPTAAQAAAVVGIDESEILALNWNGDQLTVVTVDGQKLRWKP